jgi:hypothetical protein
MDLYASIVMDVKKINYYTYMQVLQWMLKKLTTIYKNYMQVLQWMLKTNNYFRDLYVGIAYLKWPYGNYNRKDVSIAQCSF